LKISVTAIFLLLFCNYSNGQKYLLSNENIIYSFNSSSGKKIVLAKDSADKYIVFRFGTKDKVELEFPGKSKDSWQKFTYSFYLRGGGQENEGMDLNYVYFVSNNSKYIIYNTYSAREGVSRCGVKIVDMTTKNTIEIRGNINSIKGNLTDFRDNKLLEIGDELFD
jgi:hypothetical protein